MKLGDGQSIMSLRDIVTDQDLLYIDGNQDYAAAAKLDDRFKVLKLGWHTGSTPRSCDVAWWREGKLFAMEEKKPADLAGSLRNRRLNRELRGIVAEADVPVLGLRVLKSIGEDLECDLVEFWFEDFYAGKNAHWPLLEASKWAAHGLTVFLPAAPADVLGYLVRLRDALTSAGARSILAGSDQKRQLGETPFERHVRRLFDGVGPILAAKLDKYFNGNFMVAINARPMMWRAAGAHKGIVKQVEELQNEVS